MRIKPKVAFMGVFGTILLVTLHLHFLVGSVPATRLPPPHRDVGVLRNSETITKLTEVGQGIQRASAHLLTDKPFYRRGEPLWWSAFAVDSFSYAPYMGTETATLSVLSPKGDEVHTQRKALNDGMVSGNWAIPHDIPGGDYTLRLAFEKYAIGLTGGDRNVTILSYRTPRLKSQMKFKNDGYGPGDKVLAALEVVRADGSIPVGASVTFSARVDGKVIFEATQTVSGGGSAVASFTLPDAIDRGEGSLVAVIRDGGVVESTSKTIPILLNTLDIVFYPAGGYLVPEVANRVFFEARTPWGSPVDVEGTLCELRETGELDCRAEVITATHEGRGSFSFAPDIGVDYVFSVSKPKGIDQPIPLPLPTASSVSVVMAGDGDGVGAVIAAGRPLEMSLGVIDMDGKELHVKVFQRERELSAATFKIHGEEPQLIPAMLSLPSSVDGVVRVTVFSNDGKALAERLAFRQPRSSLAFEVVPAAATVTPGAPASVTIKVKDESGAPVEGAVVGVRVTDDSTLQMKPHREQAPHLPAMVYLEAEVDHLEDADLYLAGKVNSAPSLSLLLGTQGWRRFAFMDPKAALEEFGERAQRMLAVQALERPQMRRREEVVMLGMPMMEMAGAPPERANFAKMAGAAAADFGVPEEDAGEEVALDADDMADNEVEEAPPFADELPARMKRPGPIYEQVRVFSHKAPKRSAGDTQRTDFTETVYYGAGLRTDKNGEVSVAFDVSESITTFRVTVDAAAKSTATGVDDGGRGTLGFDSALIATRRPFYIEPKLPLVVLEGDTFTLPVTANFHGESATVAQLEFSTDGDAAGTASPFVFAESRSKVQLDSGSSGRVTVKVGVEAGKVGTFPITIRGAAGALADTVTRHVAVKARGFPIDRTAGGLVGPDDEGSFVVGIPDRIDEGSLDVSMRLYPSPVANLQEALKALIREPHGCFEQTSSTSYPLVMALQYFKSHSQVDPELVTWASDILAKAYKKLVSFETDTGGYEWFGQSPGHEALTAYGLLQFLDMAEVFDVDAAMVERTTKWLLSRKDDAKKGFLLNPRALDSFGGAPEDVTNAYIVWALTRHRISGLDSQIEAIVEASKAKDDPYFIGLTSGILYNIGRKEEAEAEAARLVRHQDDDGSVINADTSITRSRGESLLVETTSIAALVWMESDDHAALAHRAIEWLVGRCKDGRFGSTQGTVLALKAIIKYDTAQAAAARAGSVSVSVDGAEVAVATFTPESKGAIDLSSPQLVHALASPGTHKVAVRMKEGSKMPFSSKVTYRASLPATRDTGLRVSVQTTLRDATLREGTATEIEVAVRNVAQDATGMVVAVVGVPGGLEPRVDALSELVKAGRVAFFELTENEVVLYWRNIGVGETVTVPIQLTAGVPGTYKGAASRAYAFYEDENKHWIEGMAAEVL